MTKNEKKKFSSVGGVVGHALNELKGEEVKVFRMNITKNFPEFIKEQKEQAKLQIKKEGG